MPDQNQTDPNSQQTTNSSQPTSDTQMVPDFQSMDSTSNQPIIPDVAPMQDSVLGTTPSTTPITPVNDNSNLSDTPIVAAGSPKKKFGGGKIIATLLGFFLLVGGIAGGVILTQQQQDIRERASEEVRPSYACPDGQVRCQGSDGASIKCTTESECRSQACPGNQVRCKGSDGASISCVAPGTCTTTTPTTDFMTDCMAKGVPETVCRTQLNTCVQNCVNKSIPPSVCETQCKAGTIDNPSDVGSGPTLPPVSTGSCSGVKCTGPAAQPGSSCTVENGPKDLFGGTCMVIRYQCPDIKKPGEGCNQNGAVVESATLPATGCGTIQIDISCPKCGFQQTPTEAGFRSIRFTEPCRGGGGGTPPPSQPTAQCTDVKAYSSTFTALTPTQLSQLKANDQVNFCVRGSSSTGNFNKAVFMINGEMKPETTTKRPGSNDFCQNYAVPAGVNNFSVAGYVYHETLGWK